MLSPTIEIGNHKVRITGMEPLVLVSIRNRFGFLMHWSGTTPPSERVLQELIDIHQRTFAGHMRIN